MDWDWKQYINKEKLSKIRFRYFKELAIAVVFLAVMAALFTGTKDEVTGAKTRVVTPGLTSSLQLDVIDVNPVIARHFGLANHAGVLVNDVPVGSSRRLSGIKRGDVILAYNGVEVQTAHHLGHLMSQAQPGDTASFVVSRGGAIRNFNVKVPVDAGISKLYEPRFSSYFVAILILLLTFAALFFQVANRTVCAVLGAAAMLVVGSVLGFYDQSQAYRAIQMEPLFILVGMSIFSIYLELLGAFDYAAKRLIVALKGETVPVILGLCGLTYVLSLFINNLTTILVLVPITLYLCKSMGIRPAPVVAGEIIASNIGGASTMVGDFPNMLISSSTGLSFLEFLTFMTPICFVLFLALLWYLNKVTLAQVPRLNSAQRRNAFVRQIKTDLSKKRYNRRGMKRVLAVLVCVIVGFMVLPAFRIRPGTIALAGGFLLLAVNTKRAQEIIKKISLADLLFFVALFILVGGAIHSGILEAISNWIAATSGGNHLLYLIALMWAAAFFTAFMNAGPSAVFFMPIAMHSPIAATGDVVWWALSLGILAGSSATLNGATAGIVAQTLMDERAGSGVKKNAKSALSFLEYSKTGVPVALIFLAISTVYMVLLCGIVR